MALTRSHDPRRLRTVAGLSLVAIAGVSFLTACAGQNPPASEAVDATSDTAPLYAELPDDIRDAGVITDLVVNHPPWIVSAEGDETGAAIDIRDALSEQLGVEFESVVGNGDLAALLSGLSSGRANVFSGPLTDTAEREETFDFVNFQAAGQSFLALDDTLSGDNLEELCGKNVASITGSVTLDSAIERLSKWCTEEGLPAAQPVGLPGSADQLLALESGRADAMVSGADANQLSARDNEGKYMIVTWSEEQGNSPVRGGFALPKDSGLAPVLLKALQAIYEDGTLGEIFEEYGLGGFESEPTMNVFAE